MKLYYTKGACSLAPRIIINELNVACEFESVDLKAKRTEANRDFLEINPKGAVPVLITNDGNTLTENAVILQYLADSNHATQLLPSTNDFERYRILEWLNYIATELHKGFSPLFNPAIDQSIKDQLFIPLLKSKLSFVDKQLHHTYLYKDQFTLCDAYCFVMLHWAKFFKFNLQEWPHLNTYFTTLQQRNSIQQALEQEGLLKLATQT